MMRWLCALVIVAGATQPATLPTPGFHHLHLNSINPDAAIEFDTKQFPTTFGDVSIFWYMSQGDTPAGPTRGHLIDHLALSVTFLEPPYNVGDYRAVMIEGPSREAIELIEIR